MIIFDAVHMTAGFIGGCLGYFFAAWMWKKLEARSAKRQAKRDAQTEAVAYRSPEMIAAYNAHADRMGWCRPVAADEFTKKAN